MTIAPIKNRRAKIGMVGKLLGASGCDWGEDDVVSVPEIGTVLLFDKDNHVPSTMNGELYTVFTEPTALKPRQAWRSGPWLLVYADATLLKLAPEPPKPESADETEPPDSTAPAAGEETGETENTLFDAPGDDKQP